MDRIELGSADEDIKICPLCNDGWEEVKYQNIRPKNKVYITHYYGNWRTLGRGKEKRVCPKCVLEQSSNLET